MIKGHCRTNLDDFKREEWTEVFVAVPRIGERVESKNQYSLRVAGVTYKVMAPAGRSIRDVADYGLEPIIEIELNN